MGPSVFNGWIHQLMWGPEAEHFRSTVQVFDFKAPRGLIHLGTNSHSGKIFQHAQPLSCLSASVAIILHSSPSRALICYLFVVCLGFVDFRKLGLRIRALGIWGFRCF